MGGDGRDSDAHQFSMVLGLEILAGLWWVLSFRIFFPPQENIGNSEKVSVKFIKAITCPTVWVEGITRGCYVNCHRLQCFPIRKPYTESRLLIQKGLSMYPKNYFFEFKIVKHCHSRTPEKLNSALNCIESLALTWLQGSGFSPARNENSFATFAGKEAEPKRNRYKCTPFQPWRNMLHDANAWRNSHQSFGKAICYICGCRAYPPNYLSKNFCARIFE